MFNLTKVGSSFRFRLQTLLVIVVFVAILLGVGFKISRVKLYIDSANVPGWNEIDAVGLVDQAGRRQWATKAYASSAFGRNNNLPTR